MNYDISKLAVLSFGLTLSTIACNASDNVATNGLIGYWSGDGTAVDGSMVGNNGSFGGSYAPSPTGGRAFNLATGKVTVPNNPAFNFKSYDGWSVGFWFNGNGSPVSANNGLFLGQDNASGYNPKWFIDYGYNVYANNSSFNLHVNDYNTERIFVPSQSVSPPTGWNQLTVTVNNTNNGAVNFYLNGQPIGTGSLGNYVLKTTAPLVFGQAESLSFNGLISGVVIYNRVLSTNEVMRLATAIISETPDGNGNVVITWQSSPGSIYQLLGATQLAPVDNWANVGSPVIATGTNTSTTFPITSPINFFKVQIP